MSRRPLSAGESGARAAAAPGRFALSGDGSRSSGRLASLALLGSARAPRVGSRRFALLVGARASRRRSRRAAFAPEVVRSVPSARPSAEPRRRAECTPKRRAAPARRVHARAQRRASAAERTPERAAPARRGRADAQRPDVDGPPVPSGPRDQRLSCSSPSAFRMSSMLCSPLFFFAACARAGPPSFAAAGLAAAWAVAARFDAGST